MVPAGALDGRAAAGVAGETAPPAGAGAGLGSVVAASGACAAPPINPVPLRTSTSNAAASSSAAALTAQPAGVSHQLFTALASGRGKAGDDTGVPPRSATRRTALMSCWREES